MNSKLSESEVKYLWDFDKISQKENALEVKNKILNLLKKYRVKYADYIEYGRDEGYWFVRLYQARGKYIMTIPFVYYCKDDYFYIDDVLDNTNIRIIKWKLWGYYIPYKYADDEYKIYYNRVLGFKVEELREVKPLKNLSALKKEFGKDGKIIKK